MATKFVALHVEANSDNRHKPKLQLDPFLKSKFSSFHSLSASVSEQGGGFAADIPLNGPRRLPNRCLGV